MPRINDRQKLDQFKAYRPEGQGIKTLDATEKKKTVDNNISEITFFVDGAGGSRPFLTTKPSTVVDPGKLAKVLDVTAEQKAALRNDAAGFAALIDGTMAAKQAYFRPQFGQLEGAPTRFKFNNIVGQRIKQFVDEARSLADELYPRDAAKKDGAYYVANTRAFELLAREIHFDDFEIDGYASFGHDAAFIHAWEKRLEELDKVDVALLSPAQKTAHDHEKKQLQNELDAIFRDKYVFNSNSMYEVNAEISVQLVMIDPVSRQRVSEKESSLQTIVPQFEILNLAGRAVYFDNDQKKYYFDRGNEVVPDAQVANIQRRDVAANDLTFRRAVGEEHLRKNFRFDWNGDGYVQSSVIDWVSWGGHCNDKANLEAKGLVLPASHNGVYEYNSLTGSTAHYNRNLLNEKLMSFSEMSSLRADQQQFAGARDDDRPDLLSFGGVNVPANDRPNELTIKTIDKAGTAYDPDKSFGEYIVAADGKSADRNPLYLDTQQGDRVRLNLGGAKVTLDSKVQVFDEHSGYPTMKSQTLVIDFANPPEKPILVDSAMINPSTREMQEVSLDVKNKTLVTQRVKMEKKADGTYEKKNVGAAQTRRIDPAQLVGVRETSLDNPNLYFEFIKEALLKAENFTSETADGAGVWNGRTKRLKEAVVFRDDNTKWAKVELEVDAKFGAGSGAFLVKMNDDGTPKFFVPVKFAFDFAWRTAVSFDPQFEAQARSTPVQRGVIYSEGGQVHAEAVSNMLELLHCAFNARPYVIQHEGVRYFFETKAQWEAEKLKLDMMRGAIYGAIVDPPPPVGEVVIATLLEDAGQLAKGALKQHQLVAEADGKMTIKLGTQAGDADLFVKLGGAATNRDYTHKAEAGGLAPDDLTFDVKKGDVIGIAALGYAASQFTLNVSGPKAANVPPPAPAPISFHTNGVVAKNEEKHFQLEIKEDATLRVRLEGSNDADVYLRRGSKPTAKQGESDFRLYGPTSNESGTFDVKKGEVIYGMVRGYAQRSEFDLNVNS
jgi:hypothetical protein